MASACRQREPFSIDLLYSDNVGAQRTISRFMVNPAVDDRWVCEVIRNWHLDRPGPRSAL